jgi:hypothetical protein
MIKDNWLIAGLPVCSRFGGYDQRRQQFQQWLHQPPSGGYDKKDKLAAEDNALKSSSRPHGWLCQ